MQNWNQAERQKRREREPVVAIPLPAHVYADRKQPEQREKIDLFHRLDLLTLTRKQPDKPQQNGHGDLRVAIEERADPFDHREDHVQPHRIFQIGIAKHVLVKVIMQEIAERAVCAKVNHPGNPHRGHHGDEQRARANRPLPLAHAEQRNGDHAHPGDVERQQRELSKEQHAR
ncbi:hypothetical protein SDC9_172307 [bioreactor metagenome]|uniref:Uncharacterized protein n=1 Tax=bioreactor metagenome TaxID=1076179 RepID=A0A645GFT5_9ZZZZ